MIIPEYRRQIIYEKYFDLGFGHTRKNITVEMHGAALVFGVRGHFTHGLQYPHTLVAISFKPSKPRPRNHWEKLTQLALSTFIPFSAPQNLTETAFIHGNCYQNGNLFVFSALVAAQIDASHADIRIPSALQRTVPPVLDVNVRFLVQLTDGGR